MLTHSTKDVAFVFRKLVGDEINPGFLQSAYLLFKASPKRVDELVHCCRYYGIPPARPPRAKTTRWDSILKAADTDSAIAPALFGWSAAHSATDAGALGLLHSMQHVLVLWCGHAPGRPAASAHRVQGSHRSVVPRFIPWLRCRRSAMYRTAPCTAVSSGVLSATRR